MKSPRFYLDVHEQTEWLVSASEDVTREPFLGDRTLILAVERSLEIVGEAVGKLDDSFKDAHPEVPWRSIRGLRNVLAHMYWAVNLDAIWNVVTRDVPELHEQVRRLLDRLPDRP